MFKNLNVQSAVLADGSNYEQKFESNQCLTFPLISKIYDTGIKQIDKNNETEHNLCLT